MNSRLVPERTIDSLLAVEAVRHNPHSLIWSPTQTKGSYDHEVIASVQEMWVLECKAVFGASDNMWFTEVDRVQLDENLRREISVVYVFLTRPLNYKEPHQRPCWEYDCAGHQCRSCCYDVRSFSDRVAHVEHADPVRRLQPWFCHWTWTIDAFHLNELLESSPPPNGRRKKLETTDDSFAELAIGYQAQRLCHFLESMVTTTAEYRDITKRSSIHYQTPVEVGYRRPMSGSELAERLPEIPRSAAKTSTPPIFLEASPYTAE